MGKLARFGVSLDTELLAQFDNFLREKDYATRSEAIRDLIRASLLENKWNKSEFGGGTLTLVYDHHRHDLSRKLMALQHEDHDIIVTTMHVHLDHHNCLEVLVLKGDRGRVLALAQKLVSCRGVVHGVFTPAPTEGEFV